MSSKDTQVLIIGAGVVGLSASLFLAQHGISSIVVERRAGTSIHPRARSVNQRTVELFRHLGIDEKVHAAGKSIASSMGIYVGNSLQEVVGPKPRRAEGKKKFPLMWVSETWSPVSGTFVTQDMLEPVLVSEAEKRGVDVRFNQESQSVEQDGMSVTATLKDRDSGEITKLTADYLIAADGAKSRIRQQLDVPTTGRGAMGYKMNILFHADLADFVKDREFSICKIERPEVSGIFTSINNNDRWVFHLSYDPSKGEKPSDFTKEKCEELLRIASGMPDLKIQIDSILPWEPTVLIAEKLRHDRIFLAGDAAHQMPPWGGQGANSGISDAYNLAWKLALTLKGQADLALLDTYEVERIPVARSAAEASAVGADKKGMIDPKLSPSVIAGLFMKARLVQGFGYGYRSKAICEESNWPLGGLTWTPFSAPSLLQSLDGRPGRRAPHLWVQKDGKRISTIDVVGTQFVILAGEDGDDWRHAAKRVSDELKVEVAVYTVGEHGDLVINGREFDTAAGVTSRGALLVRPDDFVACRWRRAPRAPDEELRAALDKVLGLK